MSDFIGTVGDDTAVGTGGEDSFDFSQGGADTLQGGDGGDTFLLGAAFSADDRIDGGGGGLDTLYLDGDYSAGLVLDPDTIQNISEIVAVAGHSYDLTLDDANVGLADLVFAALGTTRLDDRAETSNGIYFEDQSGSSTLLAGAGADEFAAGDLAGLRGLRAREHFDGGAGIDILLVLNATHARLAAASLANVEIVQFHAGRGDMWLALNDANLAAGQTMSIEAGDLTDSDHLTFNGSAERNGVFDIQGGAAADTLTGGKRIDTIEGGAGDDHIGGRGGADLLSGGEGADVFIYRAVGDSSRVHRDLITDFHSGDNVDLSAVDADRTQGGNQAFHIVSAFTGAAGELIIGFDDDTFIAGDVNGDGKADLVIDLTGSHLELSHIVL